jgi:predicted TIM-barrel fold metal-dependent hydrolase
LIHTFPEVNLFTPMLVDFLGLDDFPNTSTLVQLAINEKISRLSMRGDLGPAVHPFAGFDPRRAGAVAIAQEAVYKWGCVGVKMYPPMGFLPIGNRVALPKNMSADEAIGVEDELRRLYTWCQAEQVPITAHSNPSNYADDAFKNFAAPANWKRVLEDWPKLHLNLGHFGWGGRELRWPQTIAAMATDYPHLHADVGNHDGREVEELFALLEVLFGNPATEEMRKRFMFGTDWFMLASHPDYEEFLKLLQAAYKTRFPDDIDTFMGNAALSFLGFNDPTNLNAKRLGSRYEQYRYPLPNWLAT